jgi:hypothetical protein
MARRATRKSKGLFRRVYSPIQHLIEASRNVSRSVFRRGGKVVDNTLGLGQNVGGTLAKHLNGTVKNVLSRKNRKNSRKNRKNSRKNSRRNRK